MLLQMFYPRRHLLEEGAPYGKGMTYHRLFPQRRVFVRLLV